MDREGEEADGGRRTRRRRGLLQMYYGEAENTEDTKKKANPLDINGDSFNSQKYLEVLLREEGLPKLIKKETELDREVKSLESDIQTLVYENYNKFISATDTIRQMKTKVDVMEEEMQKLQLHMSQTASISHGINTALGPRREEIAQCVAKHTALQQFQFVFELPARLRECLDMGMQEQAIHYYNKGLVAMEPHKDKESFKAILSSCQATMTGLHEDLKEKLSSSTVSTRDVRELVRLLAQLGFDDLEDLARVLLNKAAAQFALDEDTLVSSYEKDLGAFKAATPSPQNGDDDDDDDDDGVNGTHDDNDQGDEDGGHEGADPGGKRISHEKNDREEAANDEGRDDATDYNPSTTEGSPEDDAQESSPTTTEARLHDDKTMSSEKSHNEHSADDSNNTASRLATASSTAEAGETTKEERHQKSTRGKEKVTKKKKTKKKAKARFPPLTHLITSIGKTVFFNLAEWIICYQDIFFNQGGETEKELEEEDAENVLEVDDSEVASAAPHISERLDDATRAKLHLALDEMISALVVEKLLPFVSTRLSEFVLGNVAGDDAAEVHLCSTRELVHHLETLSKRIGKLLSVSGDLPSVREAFDELVYSHIRSHFQRNLTDITRSLASALDQLPTGHDVCDEGNSGAAFLVNMESMEQVAGILLDVYQQGELVTSAKFFSSIRKLREEFIPKILFEGVVLQGLDYISTTMASHASRSSWASLSVLIACDALANDILPKLAKAITSEQPDALKRLMMRGVRQRILALKKEKAAVLQLFVRRFSAETMQELFNALRNRTDSSSNSSDGVSDGDGDGDDDTARELLFQQIVARLGAVSAAIKNHFPLPTQPSGNELQGKAGLAAFSAKIHVAGTTNIHRLFSDKIATYAEVDASSESILRALLFATLKGFSELMKGFTVSPELSAFIQSSLVQLHKDVAPLVFTDETESSVNTLFAKCVSVLLGQCDHKPTLISALSSE